MMSLIYFKECNLYNQKLDNETIDFYTFLHYFKLSHSDYNGWHDSIKTCVIMCVTIVAKTSHVVICIVIIF